jgi:hypothetical protein
MAARIMCGKCHQWGRLTAPVREWHCPLCGWSPEDQTRLAVTSQGTIEVAAATTTEARPADEHDLDPLTAEAERIHAEASDLARRRRPDPLVVSTLKRDLRKVQKHIDSVADPRRRTRLALLASQARQRLLDADATLASLAERDEQRAGTIYRRPSDRELHRRIGPVQRYDDET